MHLPRGLTLDQMSTKWAAIIDPLLSNPSLDSVILTNVSLAFGNNTINHLLGRKLIGWRIIRQRSSGIIWDNQDNNPAPDKTLILSTNTSVTVDVEVF